MKEKQKKLSKDMLPDGITVPMALIDFLPVLFFGATGFLLGKIAGNLLVEFCSLVVFLSGLLKAIWKLIVAVKRKNIWPLFLQMRIVMPIGFLGMLIGLLISFLHTDQAAVLAALLAFPQLIFFLIGLLGICLMVVCSVKLNSADAKANWIEQGINSFAQASIFLGVLLIAMK